MDLELSDDIIERLDQLGTPLAEFGIGRRRLQWTIVSGVFMVLFGIVLTAICVGLCWLVLKRGGGGSLKLILICGALGVSMVLWGIARPVRAYRNLGLLVLVFPEGLVRLRGDQFESIWWDEVAALQRSSSQMFKLVGKGIVIHRVNGTQVTFDASLPQFDKFVEIVERQTLLILWPACQESFMEGKPLTFGLLSINRRNLTLE